MALLSNSYAVNSNAPPVIVTITNPIGVTQIISVRNSVSDILTDADQLEVFDILNGTSSLSGTLSSDQDLVNYVTDGDLVIASYYGPVDLTNPAYITNTAAGAIQTFTLRGKIMGQSFSGASGINPGAEHQLLPIGVKPSTVPLD